MRRRTQRLYGADARAWLEAQRELHADLRTVEVPMKKTKKRVSEEHVEKKRVPPKKLTKKQRAEADLLAKLCEEHGYTMAPNPPRDRITMMYSRAKRSITPYYTMTLAVPMDSEMALQMLKLYPTKDAKP